MATDGIRVVDLTDPARPRQIATLPLTPSPTTLTLAGNQLDAIRAGEQPSLTVVDVTNPAQPQVVGTLPAVTSVEGLALAGTTLSVSNGVFALDVLDVSDPSRPALHSQLAAPGGIVALAAAPPYVYAVGGPQTRNGQFVPGILTVIDVADPARPALVGTLTLSGNPRAVSVMGQHVLVATTPTCAGPGNTGGGLTVIGVADPTHPTQTGVLPVQVGCEARLQVATSGASAYLTASLGRTGGVLDVVDVADPQHPALTATVSEPTYPTPAVAGHTVYLGLGNSLHVFDVADPAHPREVAVVASPGLLAALALSGQTLVGTCHGLGAINLAVEGDTIYAGTLSDGVWVLRALYATQAGLPAPPAVPHDARYFAQTGYRIDDDTFWDYFNQRGGVATFGYPTSRVFTLQGFPVQFFQRQVLQRFPDGSVHLLNLLDPGLMPYTTFNGPVLPATDPSLIAQAPAVGSAGYAVVRFVQQQAPDSWNGLPVHFQQTFRHSVNLADAFPSGNANPALLPLLDLEVWGLPTSPPSFDPANHNFVYQRFQRGIMHYDAACACTQGILLADSLKAILTATNLPAGLAAEVANSPFFAQYCPGAPHWLCRPEDLPGTDLTNAFVPE